LTKIDGFGTSMEEKKPASPRIQYRVPGRKGPERAKGGRGSKRQRNDVKKKKTNLHGPVSHI